MAVAHDLHNDVAGKSVAGKSVVASAAHGRSFCTPDDVTTFLGKSVGCNSVSLVPTSASGRSDMSDGSLKPAAIPKLPTTYEIGSSSENDDNTSTSSFGN